MGPIRLGPTVSLYLKLWQDGEKHEFQLQFVCHICLYIDVASFEREEKKTNFAAVCDN